MDWLTSCLSLRSANLMASESSESSEQLADVIRRRFPKDVKLLRQTLSASHPQKSAELNKQTAKKNALGL